MGIIEIMIEIHWTENNPEKKHWAEANLGNLLKTYHLGWCDPEEILDEDIGMSCFFFVRKDRRYEARELLNRVMSDDIRYVGYQIILHDYKEFEQNDQEILKIYKNR